MIQRTLLVTLVVLYPFRLTSAVDWPQWQGPDRNGVSKETGLLSSWPAKGPKLLWIFRDAGEGCSCMSVVGDRLYSMGAKGEKEYVYALDLNTQKKLWSVEVGPRFVEGFGNGPCSTPTIDGNFLYALGRHGNLVCVETASGRKVWSQHLVENLGGRNDWLEGYNESPLVDGDRVVVTPGGKQGTIAALDKKTGKLKWRSTTLTDQAGSTSMIAIEVDSVRQYVQKTLSHLVGVRASDGKLLWKKRSEARAACTPINHNNCVYYCTRASCRLLKLMLDGDRFKAEPIYADNEEMQNWYSGVILVGEYLYGYSDCEYSDKVGWRCQDFKTGKLVWRGKPTPRNMGRGSVTCADGNLYGYHEKSGDVVLLKTTPVGYQEQGKFRIPEQTKIKRGDGSGGFYTRPVVANGKLYLRDQDLIFCYNVRNRSDGLVR